MDGMNIWDCTDTRINPDYPGQFNIQACFFICLTKGCLSYRFAAVDPPAGQTPYMKIITLCEKHLVPFDYRDTNNNWRQDSLLTNARSA